MCVATISTLRLCSDSQNQGEEDAAKGGEKEELSKTALGVMGQPFVRLDNKGLLRKGITTTEEGGEEPSRENLDRACDGEGRSALQGRQAKRWWVVKQSHPLKPLVYELRKMLL